MVKAIILDVDGVIVGDKPGYNFPDPHPAVIHTLKEIRQKGVYLSLCTAKPAFAIEDIITKAHLNNLHITDGGAVIVDPIDKQIASQHTINKNIAKQLIAYYIDKHVYLEFYNAFDYYIIDKQQNELTQKHALTLKRKPQLVHDINSFLQTNDFVKLFLIAKDEKEKDVVTQIFQERFSEVLTLSWTIHPNTLPWQFGIVTAKGISKRRGAIEISENLHVPLENILGVGDTTHDWQFMQECGYVAAMGNGSDELKKLVVEKKEKSYIGESVNENGIIRILNHFLVE